MFHVITIIAYTFEDEMLIIFKKSAIIKLAQILSIYKTAMFYTFRTIQM